jgi:hypothetical protein
MYIFNLLILGYGQQQLTRFPVLMSGNQKPIRLSRSIFDALKQLPEKHGSLKESADFLQIKLSGDYVSVFSKDFPPYAELITKRKILELFKTTRPGEIISSSSLSPDMVDYIDKKIISSNYTYERIGAAKFYIQPNFRLNLSAKSSRFAQITFGSPFHQPAGLFEQKDPRESAALVKITDKSTLAKRNKDRDHVDITQEFLISFPFVNSSFAQQAETIREAYSEFNIWIKGENDAMDKTVLERTTGYPDWVKLSTLKNCNSIEDLQRVDPDRFKGILKIFVQNMKSAGFETEDAVREDLAKSSMQPVIDFAFQFLGSDGKEVSVSMR